MAQIKQMIFHTDGTQEVIWVEPSTDPAPEKERSIWDELDAAYQEGVNSVE